MKDNIWHFGMKAHVGTDTKGRVHSVATTTAPAHDVLVMETCLHGGEETIHADKAYADQGKKERAEHPFGVIKHLWGYRKVRYRGLVKNTAQLFTLFALANFHLVRRELAAT